MDTRLPLYKEMFREAAGEIGMDWRLLAAIGYQESHWNPAAVSPTGVKGIMMLTQDTAGMMGVQDRENARESIFGGARYLMRVKDKVPERIPEPDRTWFTLAAYNIGFGHLEDARIITETLGGNPDDWSEVRANLPLLTQKKWYSRVKRGYARGWAPVHYVDNIRSYYEALMWLMSGELTDPIITREDSETPAEDNAG
jgi:membrane-bound lytic murein transglycosylase F